MKLFKFLEFLKKRTTGKAFPNKDTLFLWEDDYLMKELLPLDNLDFVKSETHRINNFGKEHFNGSGFTDVTPINEKPVKTIEKSIDINEVESIMTQAGLQKLNKFYMQDVGLLINDKEVLGFGTNKFAIMCDQQANLLNHIWLTGHPETIEEEQSLISALLLFGQAYNFLAVNWYHCEYFNLVEKNSVEEFVNTIS